MGEAIGRSAEVFARDRLRLVTIGGHPFRALLRRNSRGDVASSMEFHWAWAGIAAAEQPLAQIEE